MENEAFHPEHVNAHARLGDLEHRAAEVLAELSLDEVGPPELLLPIAIMVLELRVPDQ